MVWDGVSEPDARLKPEIAAAGLTVFLDTNIIGDESEATVLLWRCRQEGWIRLQRTDVMETEHLKLPPNEEHKRGVASELAEVMTPFVFGHSRLDSSILGDIDDGEHIARAFKILHPRADWDATRRNNIRDAMIVAGCARYAGDFLTTRDTNMLKKGDLLHAAFGIRCATPEAVESEARRAIKTTLQGHSLTGRPKWVPAWTP